MFKVTTDSKYKYPVAPNISKSKFWCLQKNQIRVLILLTLKPNKADCI